MALLAACAVPQAALATKPCLPPPCETATGGVDAARCSERADWIATGTIVRVVHHEEGPPLLKDFAEFTFVVAGVTKGHVTPGQSIRFHVGWCDNARTLPADTSGRFRFYGFALPADASLPNRFLDFERAPATP